MVCVEENFSFPFFPELVGQLSSRPVPGICPTLKNGGGNPIPPPTKVLINGGLKTSSTNALQINY